jgi:hypothetical protein
MIASITVLRDFKWVLTVSGVMWTGLVWLRIGTGGELL